MEPSEDRGRKRRAMGMAVAACAAVFALFLPAWYFVEKKVRASKDFETEVPACLERGDVRFGLAVARLAWQENPLDAEACHLYAKALMRNGKAEKAAKQYDRLFLTDCTWNENYDPLRPAAASPMVATRRPYFHCEARLEWGYHCLTKGDLTEAIRNFEIARAYGQEPPDRWWPFLRKAYGDFGASTRGFDLAVPKDDEMDGLDPGALLGLVRWCACEGRWALCQDAAQALLSRDGLATEGHFWAGRSLLSDGRAEEALPHFAEASASGYGDAGFFLGSALERLGRPEEALAAYLDASEESVFLPFCLGKALLLIQNGEGDGERQERVRELQERLHFALATESATPHNDVSGSVAHLLVGFTVRGGAPVPNSPFQLLTSWIRNNPNEDLGTRRVFVEEVSPTRFVVGLGERYLDLRWTRNMVPFGSFESLPEGMGDVPGWPAFFGQFEMNEPEKSLAVQTQDGVGCVRVSSKMERGRAMNYCVALDAEGCGHYLLAVRCVSDGARLVAGWEWFGRRDVPIESQNVVNQKLVREWSWRGIYKERPPHATTVRAMVGVYKDCGAALFDEVIIVPLPPLQVTFAN